VVVPLYSLCVNGQPYFIKCLVPGISLLATTLEPSLLSASSFGVGKFSSSLSLHHLVPSFLQVTVRWSRCKPYRIFVCIGVSVCACV
jgi:hypothetical protein